MLSYKIKAISVLSGQHNQFIVETLVKSSTFLKTHPHETICNQKLGLKRMVHMTMMKSGT